MTYLRSRQRSGLIHNGTIIVRYGQGPAPA